MRRRVPCAAAAVTDLGPSGSHLCSDRPDQPGRHCTRERLGDRRHFTVTLAFSLPPFSSLSPSSPGSHPRSTRTQAGGGAQAASTGLPSWLNGREGKPFDQEKKGGTGGAAAPWAGAGGEDVALLQPPPRWEPEGPLRGTGDL